MPATGTSAAWIFWKTEKNPSFPAEDLYAGRKENLERGVQGASSARDGGGKGGEAEVVVWVSLTSFLGRSGPRWWRTVSASPWDPERRGRKDLCLDPG